MSRLALLSTTDAVDPLPLTRLGPPVRHAEERRAAQLADPAWRRREAEKAFEQRVHPTPDGQHQYTIQSSTLDVASTTVYRAAWAPQSDVLNMDLSTLEQRVVALQNAIVMEESTALKPGLDVYTQAAAAHFGVEPARVTKTQRDWIKAWMYNSTYSTVAAPKGLVPVSLDEMLEKIKSFEQDRAAVLRKSHNTPQPKAAPATKPKPGKSVFTTVSASFYNGLWNKVIDLFKSANGMSRNLTVEGLRAALALEPHSKVLTSGWATSNNLLLIHAVLVLDSYDNRLLSCIARQQLRDACLALSSVAVRYESVERLVNGALGACGIPAVSTTFLLAKMTTNTRGTVNFNTPKQPLPEDDEPESDDYEAAQLRAYVAQAKD